MSITRGEPRHPVGRGARVEHHPMSITRREPRHPINADGMATCQGNADSMANCRWHHPMSDTRREPSWGTRSAFAAELGLGSGLPGTGLAQSLGLWSEPGTGLQALGLGGLGDLLLLLGLTPLLWSAAAVGWESR